MRFSRRTAWDRTPNEMARLLEDARAIGGCDADLTETNPTRAGLAADPARLAEALARPRNVSYEPEALGMSSAREAVSRMLAEGGADVPASRIVLTTSTSEAYSHLFQLCCDPGDAVLVPSPGYPLFDDLARLANVETSPYALRLHEAAWRVDVDAVAAGMPERCRAFIAVSPNNPTGSVLSEPEARGLAGLCAERGIPFVSDEVFGEFAWRERRPSAVLGACRDAGALGVVLSGLSKACGLPQLKLGWMILDGPEAAVAEALARLELIADTFLSVGTPVQHALPQLLEMGAEFRSRLRPRLNANLATLTDAAADCGARVLPAEAGWSAILALPEGLDEHEVVEVLLREDRVLVNPGWLFDLPMPALVVSLLPDEATFALGIRRVARRVADRGKLGAPRRSP